MRQQGYSCTYLGRKISRSDRELLESRIVVVPFAHGYPGKWGGQALYTTPPRSAALNSNLHVLALLERSDALTDRFHDARNIRPEDGWVRLH